MRRAGGDTGRPYPFSIHLASSWPSSPVIGFGRLADLASCKRRSVRACVPTYPYLPPTAYLPLPTPTNKRGRALAPPLDYLPFPVTVATKAKTATAIKYPTSSGCVLNLSGDCGEGRSGLSVNYAVNPAEQFGRTPADFCRLILPGGVMPPVFC